MVKTRALDRGKTNGARIAALVLILFIAATMQLSAQAKAESAQTVEQRLSSLEESVKLLMTWVRTLMSRSPGTSAHLDCNSHKYSELVPEGSHLVFLASCDAIEPYLEGHRVTITIGNPHAVTFNILKGSLGYGDELLKTWSQQVDLPTAADLKPGSWNRITVTINPSTPKDLRELRLEFTLNAAVLRR